MAIQTHTALHVLKGAVQDILKATLTTGVYVQGHQGRLVVQFDRKPTEAEIKAIEHKCNLKIEESIDIEEFEMDRTEAEQKYGNIIYDAFPIPDHVKLLKIVRIPEWNINACNHEHLLNTSEVGEIQIRKIRYRNAKNQLEISFRIL